MMHRIRGPVFRLGIETAAWSRACSAWAHSPDVAGNVAAGLTKGVCRIAVDRPPAVTAPSLLRPDSRPLLYAVAAIVAALAAIAFVLSFSALRDLAVAAHVSVELAWLWPLAVDGNIVVNTVAGLLLRPRGRTVSWYPWAALFLFSAVSVVGNGLHATTTSGRLALDPVVAFVVSAIPAVALLQGSHLFVVMLSAPASRPDILLAPVGAATQIMPARTNRQPSTGRDGRGKAEVVVVGGTQPLSSPTVNGDGRATWTCCEPGSTKPRERVGG
jgi:Protein of unknown function (DUF2637)